jgi:hypothetical protein
MRPRPEITDDEIDRFAAILARLLAAAWRRRKAA